MNNTTTHPFEALSPSYIIDAVESKGYISDGRLLALNSYENRVYQVGIEDETPLIIKFYRPNRWSNEQILEEHQFSFELEEHELPIVTPIRDKANQSLFSYDDNNTPFHFALFPRKGGHAPELDNFDNLLILGRLMGRIHQVGASKAFINRPQINIRSYGQDSVDFITEHFIPAELKTAYTSLTIELIKVIENIFNATQNINYLRTHSDCHIGNILWRDNAPNFVDLDDARMAPAIQDLWMFLSGDRAEKTAQLSELIEGYSEFNDFNLRELQLIESLRTLRMLYYSAWIARRWDDPAFPHNFPWFNTPRYWGDHILELREQQALLNEPALTLI